MTNEDLYQVVKDGFDQINQRLDRMDQRLDRMDERLDGMDTRLRTVENGISELKGKQIAITGIRNWIVTACAIGALVVSIAVAIFK